MSISLRVFSSVLTGQQFVADITDVAAQTWRRSTRLQGGFWQGSFSITGLSLGEMQEIFYSWLGYHVEERSGGMISWEGMIYEVDLVVAGMRRRRSLDLMANAVRVRYTDSEDNTVKETAWAVENESVKRYGRKEEVASVDDTTTAAAQAHRDTLLKEYAWPWARPVSYQPVGGAWLDVRVCGYVFTANWRYVTVQDGTLGNISDYVKDIVNTDCEFLSVGTIRQNTLQHRRQTGWAVRAWDMIQELVKRGDVSGNPWRFWVDIGRVANYDAISTNPRYYIRGPGQLQTLAGEPILSWHLRPGVVRDEMYPVRRSEYSGWLQDVRDVLISEVEVYSDGRFSLRTAEFGDAEFLTGG